MKKFFCDACGTEQKRVNEFQVPCHLYQFKGQAGYIDSEGNAISGRTNIIDLCNKCLNKAYTAAIAALDIVYQEK